MNEHDPRAFTPQEKLMAALVAARREMPPIPMSATAKIDSRKGPGSSYSFKYAPLPKILEIVSPVLSKHGLILSTPPTKNGLQITIAHEGGGVMSFEGPDLPKPAADLQAWGKACTYVKRYCVLSVLGLAAEEDADGDALPGPERTAPRQSQPPPAAPPPVPVADAQPEEVVLERIEAGFRKLEITKEEQADLWTEYQMRPDDLLAKLLELAKQGREPGQEG